MKIFVKIYGTKEYFEINIVLKETKRKYYKAEFKNYMPISETKYYRQNKSDRFIFYFIDFDQGFIHEIGNEKFFKKLLDKQNQTC